MNIEHAVVIFERINRAGRPLSRYDLITARALDDEFDLREKVQKEVVRPLEDSGFGTIEETSIPQTLALTARGKTESATQMDLTGEEIAKHWDETV